MATLCLDEEFEKRSGADLHPWLAGQWALLLSHPEDFADHGRERFRWLQSVRQECRARAVRPIGVQRDGAERHSGWPEEAQSDRQLLRLREPAFAAADPLSFATRLLRAELLTLPPRFVLIVDGTLRRRDLLKYSAGRASVSIFDLIASVDAMRRPRGFERAA